MQHAIALLTEFRKRFLNVLFVFIGLFGIGFYYSNILFYIYMLPLQRLLPPPHHLIATQITTPIITPLALAINVALFCTTPYGLWQLWRFAAPALYQAERRKLRYLLSSSLGLFCLGCLFCYFFILPFMFQCMIQALPKDVLLLPDISSVTHFIIVAAFTLGMLLTPPDVMAQILLALPLWGLYELGILIARALTQSTR